MKRDPFDVKFLVVAAATVLMLSACTTKAPPAAQTMGSSVSVPTAMTASVSSGKVTLASDVATCATCAGRGMAPMVEGAMESNNGIQVAAIGIKNGYYSPNVFTAKAGEPINVVFTGKATDCLANPTFKSLKKTINIEKTGSGTIELGALAAGTYEFGCGMGMVGGKIVVK